jgi:hypothetical protein
MKITNTQAGPRGVNTVNGPVLVDPKQTVEADVYAREQAHIEASGWFTVEGDYTANPDGSGAAAPAAHGSAAEIADLKAQLAAKETETADLKKLVPETDIDKMTVAELRAHLAYRDIKYDATKDKKDDLITLAKAAA